ncbi:MAG: hypothetical protein H7A43_03175 [Verrucomicrobia bacterium]|nr:hypothetical protein [Verrucomicrobiota bacterium]
MTVNNTERTDEVSIYYNAARRITHASSVLFWIIAVVSLAIPYVATLSDESYEEILIATFLCITLVYFSLQQVCRFYLVPRAERVRRQQLLSDALGTRLTHERTKNYYNNDYPPSIRRLGADVFENSLFSKEIASRMLVSKRWIIGAYLLLWLFAFSLRHHNLELLTWITQLVFSGEIIAGWLTLECLRFRQEKVFDQLHQHFLHDIDPDDPRAVANILDSFASYEGAKSSAGALLSTKIFDKVNESLTAEWIRIRTDLKMMRTPSGA